MRPKGEPKAKLNTYVPVDLLAMLQAYSDDSGIPQTRVVEDALRKHLSGYKWSMATADHAHARKRGAK
jgi:hypothetical protein